jgi:hypothetical protein
MPFDFCVKTSWVIDGPMLWPFEKKYSSEILTFIFDLEI